MPVFAEPPEDASDVLREKVLQFLDRPSGDILNYSSEVADIDFIITIDRQLVVLDVDCGNRKLEEYIKSKLNYKHIRIKEIVKMKPYHIRITFLKG
jgi:hypothetical protein